MAQCPRPLVYGTHVHGSIGHTNGNSRNGWQIKQSSWILTDGEMGENKDMDQNQTWTIFLICEVPPWLKLISGDGSDGSEVSVWEAVLGELQKLNPS